MQTENDTIQNHQEWKKNTNEETEAGKNEMDDKQEPSQMDRNDTKSIEKAWGNLNEINLAKYLFDWVTEWKRIWNS